MSTQPGFQNVPLGNQWPVVAQLPAVQVPPDSRTVSRERKGARVRMSIGYVHFVLGLILISCGIVVVSVQLEYQGCTSYYYPSNSYRFVERLDRQVWTIWIGAIVIVNAVLGILSRRNQVVISLYMACSIVCSVVSAVGTGPIAISLANSNNIRLDLTDDYYETHSFYFPEYTLEKECLIKNLSTARVHIAFYCIALTCLVVEFVLSIISASFTCVGLTCCSETPTQRVIYYQAQALPIQGHVVNPNGPPPPYHAHVSYAPRQPQQSMASVPTSGQPQDGITQWICS